MKWKLRLLSGLVLVGVLLSMTAAAWAEEPAEAVGLRGQVVAVDGDALLVKTSSGEERWVITDEETSFRIPGVSSPTIADIDEGDYVGVRGQRNEDGDVVATSVIVIPAEYAHRRHIVRGEVLAIEEQTLTVRTPHGERLVVTDEGTRFLIPGVEEPDIEDISVGDPILALGRPDEEGNLLARVVALVSRPQLRRHTMRGLITSIGDDTFGLATRSRVVRVQTTEETVFRIPGVEDPGLDDLNVRDLVVVVGSWRVANEVFTARAVALIPRWPSNLRFVRGEVTGIQGRAIVLDALQGEVAVQTDGETIYRIPGVEDPGLDNLEIGDKVAVLVTRTEEGALLAKVVIVRRGESPLIDVVAGPVEAAAAMVSSFPWPQSEPLEGPER
jgi:RNase P/RNase MRP subunit p29